MNAYKLSAGILLLSLLLTSCGGVEPPRPGIDIPATRRAEIAGPAVANPAQGTTEPTSGADVPQPIVTVEIPAATTTDDVSINAIINGPEAIRLHDVANVEVFLYTTLPGEQVLDEVDITLSVSLMSVEVLDAYPQISGIQVMNGDLPVGAEVLMNEVDEMGVVHYHIKGLGLQGQTAYRLSTITLRAVYPGDLEIAILSLYAHAADGTELLVNSNSPVYAQVFEEESPPTPVTPPPFEPTAQPTPVTEGGNGGLPVIVPSILQEGVYYRILRGENLYRIGLSFGVSWQEIAAVNGIRNEHYIPAGMILYIPVAAPVGSTAYYIRPGDTLYSICRGLNLRVVDVAALNGIPAPFNYIRADTWLILMP